MTTNNITKTTNPYKQYIIKEFRVDPIKRVARSYNTVSQYDGELVLITKVHNYWNDISYTVIPLNYPNSEFQAYHHELWQGKKINLVKKNNYELFNSDIFQFSDDEMLEMYKDAYNLILDEDENIDECNVWEYIHDILNYDFNDFLFEIRSFEATHGMSTYVVCADVGMWHGTYEGTKTVTGMENLIMSLINKQEDYHIYFKNGQMIISTYDHDGRTTSYIREITDAGADYMDRHEWDMEEWEMNKNIFNSHRWSMRVKMFDIMRFSW